MIQRRHRRDVDSSSLRDVADRTIKNTILTLGQQKDSVCSLTVAQHVPDQVDRIGTCIAQTFAVGIFGPLLMSGADVKGGEIMYHQGGTRAEMWRLKIVPPIAFNHERLNLTEGGLDVQGGYV
ncbi:MAG: hypothetical protein QF477_05460, partial [SAR202 cluster bacterium]|nr:hypothetical protein [SAR202 cluster bacterium]